MVVTKFCLLYNFSTFDLCRKFWEGHHPTFSSKLQKKIYSALVAFFDTSMNVSRTLNLEPLETSIPVVIFVSCKKTISYQTSQCSTNLY